MSLKNPSAFSLQPPAFSSPLRIITVGHVDHGKSTFLGRLLYDTDSLSDQQKQMLQSIASQTQHKDFPPASSLQPSVSLEWAFLLDAFLEEQAQNITIDTTQLIFRTSQRSYVMIDAPGHQEFLKNMIAGATRADAALLIIDVAEGIKEQTQRHLQLLSLMGIKQVIVLLNKMDLIDRDESLFKIRAEEIEKLFSQYELVLPQMIPIVARSGENLVTRSAKMSWYQGPTVLEALEKMTAAPSLENKPLRLVVQDVYRFDQRRLIVGRVESGTLHVGEEVIFWPGRKTSRVRSIEEWGTAEQPQSATAGKSVAITLEDPLFVERGYVGSAKAEPPLEGREISARIFWLDAEPLALNQPVTIQLGTQRVLGSLIAITNSKKNSITQHEITDVKIRLTHPLIYDCYEEIAAMGRFAIMTQERLTGGGVILTSRKNIAAERTIKSDHLTWSVSTIDRDMRKKQFGHPGMVLWLTGLSGSGKSTVARGLEALLHHHGMATMMLDGDNLRHGLCGDLGFSLEDRSENIRRTGEVAKLVAEAGLIVICALISPFNADRERVKESCLRDGIIFKEIFVDAPLEICEARDPRGLYQKARRGEIDHFTGITSPYEIPTAADAHLLTETSSSEETIHRLYEMVIFWLDAL
ncbi:MAG: adenylyl-sulfate kinase [Chthoniobacterales bacterium]|nr:adenylyl-sulfate kinase [Chthoniobacterales bacterium]